MNLEWCKCKIPETKCIGMSTEGTDNMCMKCGKLIQRIQQLEQVEGNPLIIEISIEEYNNLHKYRKGAEKALKILESTFGIV